MQKIKYFILAIIITVFFLGIQISYNGTPSVSVFGSFIAIIYESMDKGWNFSTSNWTMNFNYLLIEFLTVSLFLLISCKLNNRKYILVSLILFLFIWTFWAFTYKPYIEINLYFLSSIPFLIASILLAVFVLRDRKNR